MKVIKRDGSKVPFDKKKIREAVTKAMKNGSGIYLPDIARLIANDAEKFFNFFMKFIIYFYHFFFS